eukprot:7386904-Prymnesium_polylepis.1
MVSVERVGRLNDRLPYHRMAQRQRINPQTPLLRPITRPQNLRRVLIEALIAGSDEALEGVLFVSWCRLSVSVD